MNTCNAFPLRPGGFDLTLDLLKESGLSEGSVLVDIGCGYGDSVRLLQTIGYEAYGLDIDETRLDQARIQAQTRKQLHKQNSDLKDRFFLRDAAMLLDAQGQFFLTSSSGIIPDAFLFECSFTKLNHPELTARQVYSALKPGGFVLLSDVVTEAGNGCLAETLGAGTVAPGAACLLGRLIPADELISCFTSAGFTLNYQQDHPELLRAYAGNLILNFGPEEAQQRLGMNLRQLKTAPLTYVSMLFRK